MSDSVKETTLVERLKKERARHEPVFSLDDEARGVVETHECVECSTSPRPITYPCTLSRLLDEAIAALSRSSSEEPVAEIERNALERAVKVCEEMSDKADDKRLTLAEDGASYHAAADERAARDALHDAATAIRSLIHTTSNVPRSPGAPDATFDWLMQELSEASMRGWVGAEARETPLDDYGKRIIAELKRQLIERNARRSVLSSSPTAKAPGAVQSKEAEGGFESLVREALTADPQIARNTEAGAADLLDEIESAIRNCRAMGLGHVSTLNALAMVWSPPATQKGIPHIDTQGVIKDALLAIERELRRGPDRAWEKPWEALVSHIGIERLQQADELASKQQGIPSRERIAQMKQSLLVERNFPPCNELSNTGVPHPGKPLDARCNYNRCPACDKSIAPASEKKGEA